jgi:integrase/recombinase XerD
VMRKFLRFWGQRRFSGVGPLDIHEFLTESSRRDLSSKVVHRHLWALRSFFDFLCLRGAVDEVAPRFVRPRPTRRRVLKALSQTNIRRLIDAATNARDRAILELFYATGCAVSASL